eukprot:1191347-Prorocentrum_minimum.AAC.2
MAVDNQGMNVVAHAAACGRPCEVVNSHNPPSSQSIDWLPHQEYALLPPVIGSHIKNTLFFPL